MTESARAQSGFKTKVSSAVIVTPQEFSGSNTLEKYDQGVYINSVNALYGPSVVKMRPNNDFLKVVNGRAVQMTEGSFNDTESPTSLVLSGNSSSVYQKSYISMNFFRSLSPGESAAEGTKLSGAKIAPSHYLLDNDFGQSDLYQDGAGFEEVDSALDPVRIVSNDPFSIIIPYELVNTTDARLLDGVVDTFDVRKEVDRSSIDVPFRTKGTRGDLVNSDSYRRSYLISDEVEVFHVRQNTDSSTNPVRGTDPFLDSEDQFGISDFFGIEMTDTMTGPVSSIGYVKPPTQTLPPFKDASDVEDVINSFPTGSLPGSIDYEMRAAVSALAGNTTPGHSYLSRNHVSLARGFDYDNSKFGIDSLAFGGLLK